MGNRGIELKVKTETFNLEFTAEVDERKRITIPKPIVDVILIRKGDKVTVTVQQVHKIVEA